MKGFGFDKAITYDVGAHCHPATGFQFFLPGTVGNVHHLSMDPPREVAYRIGSGSSGLGWDWSADGWDETLGLAPLVRVELHWESSLMVGHCESVGPVVAEIRMLDCSTVSPLARKRVTPVGNVGSLPNSSSMIKMTCFFGFFSTGVGVLLC